MKHRTILLAGFLLLSSCSRGNVAMNRMNHEGMHGDSRGFLPGMNTNLASLPEAKPSEIIDVEDGDTIELNPMLIGNTIGDTEFAMYGYNGQFPGPTLKVKQGSTFTVNVKNMIDQPTTVHWHGIRLENRFDGAAGVTQEAIEPGDSFTYKVTVPDEGIFWYHPHVREDVQQDMGLYGLIHVTPDDVTAYSPVDKEQYLVLDDLLFDMQGNPVPYGSDDANYALMGRFGNEMFINGKFMGTAAAPGFSVPAGISRLFLLNAANTRTFNVQIVPFAEGKEEHPIRMTLVGGDAGRYPREITANSIVLSPSERGIVDVNLSESGKGYQIVSVTPDSTHLLSVIRTTENASQLTPVSSLTHDDVEQDIAKYHPFVEKPVDKTLHLTVDTGMGHMGHGMMMDHASPEGIEWEDTMAMMNQMSNKSNTQWKLIDEETGDENMDIHWKFKKGDVVKIRIINDSQEQGSDHAMQHPIHLHGQRFLVLSDNEVKNDNFVWKDTVLVPAGHTVDLLVEMSNVGDWMMHCHIAEHLTNGMMGMFTVE